VNPGPRPILEPPSFLSRPAVIFGLVWAVVLCLFFVSLIRQDMVLELRTMLLIGGSIIGFFYIEHLFGFSRNNRVQLAAIAPPEILRRQVTYFRRLKRLLFSVWATGVLLTAAIQGGFPLLWGLMGDPRGYADFGIPTLNGALVALYIILTLLSFHDYLTSGQRRFAIHTLLLCSYCLAIMNRGLMVYMILNLAGYYLLNRRLTSRRIIPLGLFFVVFIYLLNFLAENRHADSKTVIRQYVEDTSESAFQETAFGDLRRGGTWLLFYATAPLVNFNFNIKSVEPRYYPDYTLRALFPSVVREQVFQMQQQEYENRYALQMANTAFNTFTFYANYLRDFGLWGCVGILLIVQVLASRFYHAAIRGVFGSKLVYCGIFAAMVLTPFTDFFGTLIMIAQIFLGTLIQLGLRRAGGEFVLEKQRRFRRGFRGRPQPIPAAHGV
jgi:hypothetical protein